MCRKIVVMPMKINRFSDRNKIADKNCESFTLENYTEKEIKSTKNASKYFQLIRNKIICIVLDGFLMIAILPYVLYQWASRNERSVIIFKVILEIVLELIMWFTFAGVSMLITAAFLMEELYFNKNDCNNFKESIEISKKKEQLENCTS